MGFMRFLSILVVLLLLYDEILAKSKSKGFGSSKTLSISKPKHRYSGRSSFYSRRSGLSNSRKKALFFTAGALAGIYIGSRMRSHVYLRSYRDLYNYEVCEGQRTEFINSTGMTRTYSYFLCPDNPNQPFEKYCCWDSATGMGACCSYDVKMYVIILRNNEYKYYYYYLSIYFSNNNNNDDNNNIIQVHLST
ncbi:unnamed protein product [Schistosoma curassoni]|uniref:CX domain-containing protein n=1 Tax=Schistosoma curassoni TaxID=6186 RepID=A0A183KGV3_9TREM|nr:unnamed protein product [Schistosoma curassoni]